MGEKVDGAIVEIGRKADGQHAGGSGKSKNTGDTKTGGGDTARTGGDSGGNTGGETGEKEKKLSGLSDVKKEERNRKRRERYAEKKAAEGQTVKPRKVSTKKKKEVTPPLDISALLGTVSAMVASRPNMAHWQLTPAEIESISAPLNNILTENEAFAAMNEHSDAVALVMACIVIIAPRVMLTMQIKGAKKENERNLRNPKREPEQKPTRTPVDSDGGDSKEKPTANATTVSVNTAALGGAIAY